MIVAALKVFGKLIGGFIVLLLVYILYMSWLDKRKEMIFASCKLDYLTLQPEAKDEKRQYEYLRTCMSKSGYQFRIGTYCMDYSDINFSGLCYETGFLPF